MRALAMTGIETAAMMPSIMSGSLMRDTPPWARMSAGTRSSAMTATAPGVLGDLRLLGRDDVHDHAALEHLGHAALDARGADLRGAGGGLGLRGHGDLGAVGGGPADGAGRV